jgi:hypothetical protein
VRALTLETSGLGGRSNKDKCSFMLYVDVNSVQGMMNNSNTDINDLKNGGKDLEFTDKDMEFFETLKKEPDVFKYFSFKPLFAPTLNIMNNIIGKMVRFFKTSTKAANWNAKLDIFRAKIYEFRYKKIFRDSKISGDYFELQATQ